MTYFFLPPPPRLIIQSIEILVLLHSTLYQLAYTVCIELPTKVHTYSMYQFQIVSSRLLSVCFLMRRAKTVTSLQQYCTNEQRSSSSHYCPDERMRSYRYHVVIVTRKIGGILIRDTVDKEAVKQTMTV